MTLHGHQTMNVTSQLLPGPPADSLNIIMNNTLHYTHMQNLIIKKKKNHFQYFSLFVIYFFLFASGVQMSSILV
jgi:hypothetical protein